MTDLLEHTDLSQQNAALQAEILRLKKMVDALVERAEQAMDLSQTDYGMFQSTILLEDQVRTRTHELEAALQQSENISHELKVANEKIEQSELRFRNILENSPIGMCILDKTYKFFLVNKAFSKIVGYGKAELYTLTPANLSHPDDMVWSGEQLQRMMNGELDSYQLEKRYIRKDGSVVWVHLTTSLLRDAQGEPWNLIGQVQDITARKLLEDKQRLATTVYNCSNEAMMVTDADNQIITTNPAFTALTGYSMDEVLGRNPRILGSGWQSKDFYQQMWQTLASAGHWEGDVWNRKKNGEIYAEWLSISVVYDDKGAVQNYVSMFSDITEQKKAAEKVWEYANYDALTRLPNRRLFHDRLQQGIKQADRTGLALALFFIDLDYFKEVNDTMGHQAGDDLLVQVSNRITAKVRASDTVARLGGDEFTVILPDIVDGTDVGKLAQSLVDVLSQPFFIGTEEAHISASIGVILYPQDAKDVQSLLNGADQAMYMAKSHGRSRFCYFSAPAAGDLATP